MYISQYLNRNLLTFTCLFWISFFNPVFSKEITLKDLENYLNSINSLNSEIIQTNQNGNEILGSIKLKKPGKLRIEYHNQKADHLIVGSDGIIAVIDYNSNSEPLRYPIKGTPLKFISENNINLYGEEIVSKLKKYNNHIELEISEKKPTFGLGKIILKFKRDPIRIVGWELPISEANTTKISLNKPKVNEEIADNFFFISAEIMKFNNNKN